MLLCWFCNRKSCKVKWFQNIISAEGNVNNLKELILQNFDSKNGSLLYVSGEVVSSRLDKDLISEGYSSKRLINYTVSSTLEIKERCLLGWIAVRQFSEFENPGPPYNFCSDFSEEQLSLFRREVEGAE